ncbi:MAG: hypothetical protein K1W16_03525 [Lachnospiraceae bacterium]|jgi:hypothetical protein
MKEQIQLFKIVFDFLDNLSEEELQLLISKKARLNLEIEKTITEESKPMHVCVEKICEKIEGFSTREDALEYITGLSLLKAELKAVAKKYDIHIGSKETNNQIAEKIIENVVGSKLRFDALLNTDLKR